MLGKLIQGHYQVVQILGAEGLCHTYLAQDTWLSNHSAYVVKQLKPSSNHPESLPELRHVFTREVEALKKLGNYDQVPQLVAHFEENQEFYLVREFIEGHSLNTELQPKHGWSESQVVQLLQEILSILKVIHSHGLLHRDLKPSNLIRRQQDNQLCLVDFGCVKQAWTQVVTAQGQTSANVISIPATMNIGTAGYMSTEQVRGRPRPNSDIYALGMISIQALTGVHPSQLLEDSDRGEVIWQHQASVSAELAVVLNKMVRYHFKDRYQSASEVMEALQTLANLHFLTEYEAPPQPLVITSKGSSKNREIEPGKEFSHPNFCIRLFPKKVALSIGFASALALMVGFYYFLRLPTPASKFQHYPISIPSQNTALGNIALAKALTGHSDVVWSVATSRDGQTLASGSGDKTIKIWNLGTGELRRTLSGHLGTIWSIAFSPNGQTLASGSSDNTIKLWNLSSGKLLRTFSGHSDAVRSIASSPDGQALASGSGDNTIKLWNLSSGKLLRTFSGHLDAVRSIAFSPDGQALASGSGDNTIKLWDLGSGKLLRTFFGHTDRVISVTLSPDGQHLASGSVDKTIKIWDLSSGKLLRTLSGNSDWVNSIAISPDGQILASGIGDKIKIRDLNTLDLLHTLYSHSSDITAVSFTADGKKLISASSDKTIKLWRLL